MNNKDSKPQLSVVIPTLGRPSLAMTLLSLAGTASARKLEVIVVGIVSDAAVASEINKLEASFARLLLLPVSFQKGDSSRKKNEGAKSAESEIVAFIDDDVVVSPDWPDRVLEAFEDPEVGLMSGPGLVPRDVPLMTRLAGSVLASKAAGYVSERYTEGASRGPALVKWSRLIGCNMAYRRDAFAAVGGFEPAFWPGEEMLAAFRATGLGFKLVFHSGAKLYHYPRSTFLGFCKQIWGYGATRVRLIRHGVEIEPATLVPGVWVLSLAIMLVGSLFFAPFGWLLCLSLFLYALACAWITLDKLLETRVAADALILFLIPVMHACYGAAEWYELLLPGRDLSEAPSRGCKL